MSLSPSLVIRIVPDEGEAVDWTVHQNIFFRDVLEAISQVMPHTTATAFEYEDEEGDRITVRGDEELQAMINGWNLDLMKFSETDKPQILPKTS